MDYVKRIDVALAVEPDQANLLSGGSAGFAQKVIETWASLSSTSARAK
jgi:hypothetical protein